MILGRVIGTVWCTRKDEKLEGMKLQVVQNLNLELDPQSAFTIAVDTVGAGVGEVVLVASGSSARQTRLTDKTPVDAVIMAIVENYEVTPDEVLAGEFAARQQTIEDALARSKSI